MQRISRFRPSNGASIALLALLALLLASAGGATAASLITSRQIKDGTIKEVDLNGAYRERLKGWFAKVDASGNLLAGRHVTSVSHPAAGEFHVVFNRSVEKCAPVASIRGTADNQFYGFVTTYTPGGSTVRVVVRAPNGTPSDGAGFNLVSSC
jgi:hypothetical protein